MILTGLVFEFMLAHDNSSMDVIAGPCTHIDSGIHCTNGDRSGQCFEFLHGHLVLN